MLKPVAKDHFTRSHFTRRRRRRKPIYKRKKEMIYKKPSAKKEERKKKEEEESPNLQKADLYEAKITSITHLQGAIYKKKEEGAIYKRSRFTRNSEKRFRRPIGGSDLQETDYQEE